MTSHKTRMYFISMCKYIQMPIIPAAVEHYLQKLSTSCQSPEQTFSATQCNVTIKAKQIDTYIHLYIHMNI